MEIEELEINPRCQGCLTHIKTPLKVISKNERYYHLNCYYNMIKKSLGHFRKGVRDYKAILDKFKDKKDYMKEEKKKLKKQLIIKELEYGNNKQTS